MPPLPKSLDISPPPSTSFAGRRRVLRAIARIGSPTLSLGLLALSAALLIGISLAEASFGVELVRWYAYEGLGFGLLAGLLVFHLAVSLIAHWPRNWSQSGWVALRAGMLFLLGGALLTRWSGVDGEITLRPGQRVDSFALSDQLQLTATWVERPEEPPYEFRFRAGPRDWSTQQTVDIGEVDGVAVQVRNYVRHGKPVDEWIDDGGATGVPLLRYRLSGPKGELVADGQLTDEGLGQETFVGPIRLQMQRAAHDSMLADFNTPPDLQDHGEGLLTIYAGSQVERLAVADHVGRRVRIGKDVQAVEVELVEYLPNAHPDRMGRFVSQGEAPKNPLVELRVHLPGREKPLRQIALARKPLLTLDGVNGERCPVSFRFDHPAVTPPTSVEFLQTTDGTLHARSITAETVQVLGAVQRGQQIKLGGGFELALVGFAPRARRETRFEPESSSAIDVRDAAQFSVRVGDTVGQAWLRRDDPQFQTTVIPTSLGLLQLHLHTARQPLNASLELTELKREEPTHDAVQAAWSSALQVTEMDVGEPRTRTLENRSSQAIQIGRFQLHPLSVDEPNHGVRSITYRVSHDPGRVFKYFGGTLAFVGLLGLAMLRRTSQRLSEKVAPQVESLAAHERRHAAHATGMTPSAALTRIMNGEGRAVGDDQFAWSGDVDSSEPKAASRHWHVWLLALGLSASATLASAEPLDAPSPPQAIHTAPIHDSPVHDSPIRPSAGGADPAQALSHDASAWDWSPWAELPVRYDERIQPLDNVARDARSRHTEAIRERHPVTGMRLTPAALYISRLMDWQGWDHPDNNHLLVIEDGRSEYTHLHAADAWDQQPLFPIAEKSLRVLMSLPASESRISPAQLAQARILEPETERQLPFVAWATRLDERERAGETLTADEQAAVGLARRYWAYQEHRMGRRIRLLPPGSWQARASSNADASSTGSPNSSVASEWHTLTEVVLTPLDNSTDPTGRLRDLQKCFWDARQAYRTGNVEEFENATRSFVALARHFGAEWPGYPDAARLAWEVKLFRWNSLHPAAPLLALAALLLIAGRRSTSLWLGLCGAGAAWIVMITLFGLRAYLARRVPLTSSYESLVFAAVLLVGIALVSGWWHRSRKLLGAAAAIAALWLFLVTQFAGIYDSALRPIEPLLSSSIWLSLHAGAFVIGYACLALACGTAHRLLAQTSDSDNGHSTEDLVGWLAGLMLAGIVSLALGTFVGSVWSDQARGRFWNWEPKEVWTLATLLAYSATWQAHQTRRLTASGFALATIACFGLLTFTWLGVPRWFPERGHRFGLEDGDASSQIDLVLLASVCGLSLLWASWRTWFVQNALARTGLAQTGTTSQPAGRKSQSGSDASGSPVTANARALLPPHS